MSTMKCARFPAKGAELEVAEVSIPTPGKGQVRVRVHACGVCHSDSFTQAGAMGNSFPRIPGHEAAGQVDEIGEGVKRWKKGDRVGLGWFGGNCGTCINCRNDDLVCCSNGRVSGINFDGGYAQYLVTDENTLAHIPDDLSFEDAGPLMCAGVTVFNSMRNQGVRAGALVAVQGVGGLGHLAIQYANKMGFKVVALSSGDDKAALAKELGAHIYVNTSKDDPVKVLKSMGGAKLIVCTAPHAKSIEPLVKGLAVGGKLLLDALPMEPLSINALDLISAKCSVGGWASGDARDSEDTMEFSVTSGVRAKIEVFPLEKAQEAFTRMMDNKARFRCVIQMPK